MSSSQQPSTAPQTGPSSQVPSDTAQVQGTPAPIAGDLALAAGSRPLPEYELVRLLGRGGYGEVWQARGPGGFDVALKFVRLGEAAGGVELKALELMKSIKHPHLLPMFGAWQVHGWLIIAMELADRTLMDRLREAQKSQGLQGIPAPELLSYLHDAAQGLDFLNDYSHRTADGLLIGVQHKDVKPQNLLLVGGSVKVADFGLAKVLEHTATSASGNMYTAGYAAPEFLEGQASRWSDQYCLAVTHCILRGGRLPFEGNTAQVLAGHMARQPDLTMLPEAERPVVGRALAKKPDERWPNCRAFVTALDSANSGQPFVDETAKPAPSPHRPRKSGRRGPRRVLAAAIVLLTLCLFAGVVLWAFINSGAGLAGSQVALATHPDGAAPPKTTPEEVKPPQPPPETKPKDVKPPPPPPPAMLQLDAVAAVAVETGKSQTLEVHVQRQNCDGPIELTVEDLPKKVTAAPVTLGANQDAAQVKISAAEDAEEAVQTIRVVAILGTLRKECEVAVTVKVTPALRLLPVAEVSLEQGQGKSVVLRLERRNCPGEVKLRLDGLPNGVKCPDVVVPAAKLEGTINLTAQDDAGATTQSVRVVATAGNVEKETTFLLKIVPASKPPLGMKFVRVPKGTFYMGWDGDKKGTKTEIKEDFEIAVYTVTQGQWQELMGDNPSKFRRGGEYAKDMEKIAEADLKQFPVENVSWDDVQKFIKKLNEQNRGSGFLYRLPKEAEWEYACRGGATSEEECSYHFYFDKPTNELTSKLANFDGNYPYPSTAAKGDYLARPTKVGSYKPNKLGLYDMHGNVWQWCDDLDGASDRVLRGGSWLSLGGLCRAAYRSGNAPSNRFYFIGFRLARVPSRS